MIFISYTKTDTYYEFVGENGNKQIYPVGSIILTDDESGMIAIKNTASRQTIGLVVKPEPPFSGKFKLTLNDSSTVTAECTSTAETIAKSEISAYTSSVESVVIGDCVTEIGLQAFYRCSSLTSVTIGSGVTVIYRNAFNGCSGLTSVTCNATTPPSLSMGVFDGSTCPIYVPAESVEAYKASSSWNTYADRIQAIV